MTALFKQRRILLVEDNLVNLQMAQGILESLGFETDTAESGFLAISMIEHKKYDAVLMDIRMPEMDGYETAQRIRLLAGTGGLQIIALSADAVEGVAEKVAAAGMNGYLTKPLDTTKLVNLLQNFMGLDEKGSTCDETCIDVVGGIRRIGGNKQKYAVMLETFIENHSRDSERVTQLILEDDKEEVHRLLHNMKGIAANIGAKRLQQATVMLNAIILGATEGEIRHANQQFAIALQECCAAAQGIVDALNTEIVITMAETTERSENKNVQEILAGLLQLLADGDSQAKKYFERYTYELAHELNSSDYRQLHETITTYNLEEALAVLQMISENKIGMKIV